MPLTLLADSSMTPDVGGAFIALTSAITPILLIAYYVKQTFFPARPREEQPMPRAEADWHWRHLTDRVEGLETNQKELLQSLYELRVQLAKLTTVLEETLQRPFRGDKA